MNEKLKEPKVILGLTALILIIIVIIISVLLLTKSNENSDDSERTGENVIDSYGKTENGNIDRQSYFDVINCIKQYLEVANIKNANYYIYDNSGNYVLSVEENIIKNNIISLLSSNYINKNEITQENLYTKVEVFETPTIFIPIEIAMIQDESVKSFLVYGLIEKAENYELIKEAFMIINIDMTTNSYSIEPINGNFNNIQEVKVDKLDDKIDYNGKNKINTSYATYEDIVEDYITIYKGLALGKTEKMYELLEEEYKTLRFGNLENFKSYTEEKREDIISTMPEKFKVVQNNGNTYYICIDQNENYYLFKERAVLDYRVILDNYTINLPNEFK